jgi:hypothetical protein
MLQSNPMVLVFAIIVIVKLRQSVESAMLDVFLPVLLLMPAIYSLRIPGAPPLSCTDVVIIPLAVAAFFCRSYNFRFQRADLWVVGYAIAGFYTDFTNLDFKTAIYNVIDPGFLVGVFAYFIGKLLIEQTGNREKFAERLAVLLGAVGFVSVIEFVAKKDPFVVITHRFFASPNYGGDTFRYGFLRVKGPFLGAEEAGIVFLVGFFLALWLWFLNRSRKNVGEPRYLGLRRSTLCVGGILLGLFMTLSRGPWLGVAVGYLIARVGMVKKTRLAMIVALLLLTAGGVIVKRRVVEYSRIANQEAASGGGIVLDESTSSATYRTRLYEVFEPVAEEGGLFGWSATAYQNAAVKYPEVAPFGSIDNHYLFVWVAQGKVGLTLFILIAAEGAIALVRAILRSQQTIDTCFYFCLGGMLAGLLVVLFTVYLNGQGYTLFFLCSGWIQSLPDDDWALRSAPPFAFRRVFT